VIWFSIRIDPQEDGMLESRLPRISRGFRVPYANRKSVALLTEKHTTIQFERPMSHSVLRGGKLKSPALTFVTMRGKRIITRLHITHDGTHALYLALKANEEKLEQERREHAMPQTLTNMVVNMIDAEVDKPRSAKPSLISHLARLFQK
jgi:hypothetical protein